ncbi:5560_t:CDS:2, partial [Scutellospora calospora]
SNNQVVKSEVLDDQAAELETLNCQDKDLEVLIAYDSTDNLSDVNEHWYKDILQGVDITNNEFIPISLNILISTSKVHSLPIQFLYNRFDVNRVEEFANKLERKVIINAIKNNNEDINHELLGFFILIQKRTLQRIINEISSIDEFNYNINNNSCIIGIQNSIKRRPKGYFKLKRIANTFEKSDTKMSYEDSNYKELLATSTSHEYVQEILDTEESDIRPSNVMILISIPIQLIDFQNYENTQKKYVCHKKDHNAQTCSNNI